jgi:multidrug resistance protein
LPPGFGVLWSTVALDLIGFGIAIPVLALFAKDRFGASPTQTGLLFASFSLAQFLMAPVLGRLSDRIGRKPVILLSLFGTAIGSLITGAAVGLWMLFLGRILDGASGASVAVAQAAATDLSDPTDRPRVLGLLGAAFGIGFTIGPAIGGLAAWLGGQRAPFYVAAVLAFVNGVAAIVRVPETRQPSGPGAAAADGHAPRRAWVSRPLPGLGSLLVIGFTALMAFSAFEATFSLFGERRFDLTEASVAWVFVGIGVGSSLIQGGAIAPLSKTFSSRTLLAFGLTANAAGLLVLAGADQWYELTIALALLVVGQGISSPTITNMVATRAGRTARGRALGEQQAAGALARVIGPAVGGVLFDARVSLTYVVGACIVGIALLALARDRAPQAA